MPKKCCVPNCKENYPTGLQVSCFKFSKDEKRNESVNGMSLTCKRLWTALQVLWSTLYVVCGAFQLMAAIFFLISLEKLQLYSILVAGSWNIIIGIAGGMIACVKVLSPKRQESLIYLAATILSVNVIALLMAEWRFYFDLPKLLNAYPNHLLIDYACFVIRIATATVIVVGFLDSQFAFCSAQAAPARQKSRKGRSSNDVSDIEYIIPRSKSTKTPPQSQYYDAYAQSWVFDADHASSSNGITSPGAGSYLKLLQNGTPKNPLGRPNGVHNGSTVKHQVTTHVENQPVVQIEEASDDSTSNSDRKLHHMKSFSRSASPVILSNSSSQVSLSYNTAQSHHPPIYDYLEKLTEPQIYRSRLNTAVSSKSGDETPQYQAPQNIMSRRVETVSPQVVEPVQYASLMKELQRAIVNKKEPSSVTSPLSQSESQSQSQTHSKSSGDTEFSKELEAALQLIQDLESPNTGETPSELKDVRAPQHWRKSSEASESDKTLSAVGSMGEITSPLEGGYRVAEDRLSPHRDRISPPHHFHGKGSSIVVHYPDSQSTSGYSSPSHGATPDWSTTSSINGSSTDIVKPVSYHIHNAKSTTVISLYSQPNEPNAKGKSITLVKISGDSDPFELSKPLHEENIHSSTLILNCNPPKITNNHRFSSSTTLPFDKSTISLDNIPLNDTNTTIDVPDSKSPKTNQPKEHTPQGIWRVTSLLRKNKSHVQKKSSVHKKQSSLPKLCPELEGAIIKSESLAYLSEVELMARAKRNEDLQRQIEEKVSQQLGVPRSDSESHC